MLDKRLLTQSINGILLLDKSKDMTSNRALQKAKRLFNAKKAGHTGSLDPIATGMLPICFGEATKFSQFLLNSDKTYHVTARLGVQTTTGDSEGEMIAEHPVTNMSAKRIEKAMQKFLGKIQQIPPMFSAIKHEGQPLYRLARRGIEITRQSREVDIFSLQLHDFSEDTFTFQVHCSKGTYVRTLVEDIGCVLGCGASVTELRRLTVTPYANASMYTLENLETIFTEHHFNGLISCLLPIETAVQTFPILELSQSSAFYLRQGQAIRIHNKMDHSFVRLVSEDKTFIGIGEIIEQSKVKPKRLVVC